MNKLLAISMLRIVTLVVVLSVLAATPAAAQLGGLFNPKFRVPVTHAPQIVLQSNQRITVMPFAGECGDEFADRLLMHLSAAGKFDVLDRANLETLLREQGFQTSANVTPDSAVRLGRVLGAAAMFTGRVTRCAVEVSEPLIAPGNYRDSRGYVTTKYVRRATVRMVANVQLIDFATGRIHAARLIEAVGERVHEALGGIPEAPSADAVKTDMYRDAINQAARMVLPWQEIVEIIVYDDNDARKMQLKPAAEMMKRGDFAGAAANLRAVIASGGGPKTTQKERDRAQYDLGIALLYSGQVDEALTQIRAAIASNPNDKVFPGGLQAALKAQAAEQERRRKEADAVTFGAKANGTPDRSVTTGSTPKPVDKETTRIPVVEAKRAAGTGAAQPTAVLTNSDLVEIIREGMPEAVVLNMLKTEKWQLDKSPKALVELKRAGASAGILMAVQNYGAKPQPKR